MGVSYSIVLKQIHNDLEKEIKMFGLKGKREKSGTKYGKFSIICSSISTRVEAGDELMFLKADELPNILLNRITGSDGGMRRMRILSDQNEHLFMETKFTAKDARLIVIILAASFGLSFEEKKKSDKGNITFKFLK